jgi:NADH-quinone oxidoreductase subunit F
MTDIDLSLLQPILSKYAPLGRTALLLTLHEAQDVYGYLPEPVSVEIAKGLSIPEVDVFGVIEFYALFYSHPVGKILIHVCNDPSCALAGADSILKRMTQNVELSLGETPTVTIERAPCLGLCEHAPSMLVQGAPVVKTASETLEDLITGSGKAPQTIIGGELSILTDNCGCGHTTWREEYEELGGYQSLRKTLKMQPDEIIDEIKASGLVGRGGAAFPTGIKWEGAAKAPGSPKYVVCNADEAEPGTFKDRVLMEDVPHRIIEGIIISSYAIGATKAFIYVRGEYRNQYEILNHAVQEAYQAGFLGEDIFGSGTNVDIELRRGAGAYICGEETAQFESIEGKRGFPRIKPPFPTIHGLFGKPTVINNVETFCNIPFIIEKTAAGYRQIGTYTSPGPKLFCVSGDVSKPGLYEVPFGITFRHLLNDLAGGIRSGNRLQAALFGGAAGAFATEKDLDVRLTFEDLRNAGLPLGAGAIIILDENRDLRDVLLRLAHFFAEESCGKCFPCQIGTQRQHEILERVAVGKAFLQDIDRLREIGATMTDTSLCGLGQTASMAILSAIDHWPGLFRP